MVNIIYSLVAVFSFIVARDLFDSDKDRDVIEKCISGVKFIRKRTKENYVVYQFMANGKNVDASELSKLLQGYLGTFVKVYFNRVLTVRVYMSGIPKLVKFPLEISKSQKIQIGESPDGTVWHDFGKYPHMIVAGTTGYGKTNFLKGLMSQLDGEIVLLDLKGSDDYVKASAKNISEAVRELKKVSNELRIKRNRRVYVVVDEAAELLAPSFLTRDESKPYLYCQSAISEIARLGRSLGVSLIYSTQYPTADVLPRQVKQNCESRIVFRLPTSVASGVALDETGAEQLPSGLFGRAIYKTDRCRNIQTYLYETKETTHLRDDYSDKIRVSSDVKGSDDITIG